MEEKILRNFNIIASNPLFKSLEEDDLKKIIQNCSIKEFSENKLIFCKDEKINEFSFILKGAINLTQTSLDGDHTIIEFLHIHDSLSEIYDEFYLCDIRTSTPTTIMSLPLPFWREMLNENQFLTIEYLTNLTRKNRDLKFKNSQLKLASAKEKLATYLLDNAFFGDKKSSSFNLTHSKAEIASYLGIKPETFSRQLKELQKDGEIEIKKNKIILKNKNSLCQYCHKDIAHKCEHFSENFCTQKDN